MSRHPRLASGSEEQKLTKENVAMANIQTHFKFIDIYWIIPNHPNKPTTKASLTQDTLNLLKTYSSVRFIWSGRLPVCEVVA
ncbi:hypothetical protein QE177_14890 (plasmid) [Arsenophonus sp. aPb]|uniref:hypothetical protein n=1 Tax=Arsenophonus sp. aPb TaxID=3041619 RepID=UPI0024683FBA|nr:hypothetical protein [Arsenophonus sp. aPb]WGL99870.1 hypothetical protein QE177_14890 [Arsenophonus sp. aPb]